VTRTGEWWCEKAEVTVLVDSTGRLEPATARVTATTSPDFAAALFGSLSPPSASGRPSWTAAARARSCATTGESSFTG
jgi:hypothetical protein